MKNKTQRNTFIVLVSVLAIMASTFLFDACTKPQSITEITIIYNNRYITIINDNIHYSYFVDEELKDTLDISVDTDGIEQFILRNWSRFDISGSDDSSNFTAQFGLWELIVFDDKSERHFFSASELYPSIWNELIDLLNETMGGEYLEHVDEELLSK